MVEYKRKTAFKRLAKGMSCCGMRFVRKKDIREHMLGSHKGWAKSGEWIAYVWPCKYRGCEYWDPQCSNLVGHVHRPRSTKHKVLEDFDLTISSENGEPKLTRGHPDVLNKFMLEIQEVAPAIESQETQTSTPQAHVFPVDTDAIRESPATGNPEPRYPKISDFSELAHWSG